MYWDKFIVLGLVDLILVFEVKAIQAKQKLSLKPRINNRDRLYIWAMTVICMIV